MLHVLEGQEGAAPGFRLDGIHAGLKAGGAPDMAIVVSEVPCHAAAVFTQNAFVGAPVVFGRAVMARCRDAMRAVVVNSRNANAATGDRGLRDAARMAELVRQGLGLPGDAGVMVMSTGVIGVPLPMTLIESGIHRACDSIDNRPMQAARAIMTTDTRPKTASVQVGGATLWGMAKGAGMIHPDMATMLCVIVTDADVTAPALQAALDAANETSFSAISVDGDTSPNDTCLVLANGMAGSVDAAAFRAGLTAVCQSLARQVAFDGEGAAHRITIEVEGTVSDTDARRIGRTVATSPLVKTAIYGRDANWGRVVSAAGRSGARFDATLASLSIGDLPVFRQGTPLPFDETAALGILSQPDVIIRLGCGLGEGRATVWTCDFTPAYIDINAAYRT